MQTPGPALAVIKDDVARFEENSVKLLKLVTWMASAYELLSQLNVNHAERTRRDGDPCTTIGEWQHPS